MRLLFSILLISSSAFAATPGLKTTFWDVRDSKFTKANLDYYRGIGFGLQTVAHYRKNGKNYVAGSFAAQVPAPWDAFVGLDLNEYVQSYQDAFGKGMVARQISVSVRNNKPIYSVVYEKEYAHVQQTHDLTDQQFNQFMFTLAQSGYSITDHSSYLVKGVRLHAGVFQKSSHANMFYGFYDKAGIDNLVFQKNNENWWVRSVDVYAGPNGEPVYSVIFHHQYPGTVARFGMTLKEFEAEQKNNEANAWRLMQVKVLNGKFTALWSPSSLP